MSKYDEIAGDTYTPVMEILTCTVNSEETPESIDRPFGVVMGRVGPTND